MLKSPLISQAQRAVIALFAGLVLWVMWYDRVSWSPPPNGHHSEQSADNSGAQKIPDEIKLTDKIGIALNSFLVISTFLLWRSTRRSAKTAERALTELEAPFIIVKIIDPGIVFNNLRSIVFGDLKFSFANYGRTPAHILDFVERITAVQSGASLPSPVDPIKERGAPMPYGVIAPPNSETQPFTTPAQFDFFETAVEEPTTIWEITQRPYFRGYVRYADIFDNVYILGFCFTFDTQGNRWVLMGNKNHNYYRPEKCRTLMPDWYQPSDDPHSIRNAIFRAITQPRNSSH